MINTTVLTGRLTRDVELRYTQKGDTNGTFTLAVDRRFKNANGDREADFVNCVIWRKSAENLANFVGKGSLIGVEGRLQTRNYENKQGQRVFVTEVVVENFTLLDTRADSSNRTGYQNNQSSPFSGGDQIDVSEEELPF
ncbi:single-stranded DNA-binding protein [Fructilactobacillus vespulae]|uniref:single-stranded DNA-binding protein n=1 Tax=Fructilactobacillus vespulae TaxID=1249630 RepID=UPI0039B38CA5